MASSESFEVGRLNTVKPRIAVQVDFSKPQAEAMVISDSKTKSNSALLRFPGYVVSLFANTTANRAYDYSRTAKIYFDRYDNDKNGYLEKDEVPTTIQQQFKSWDLNQDAKVFIKDNRRELRTGSVAVTNSSTFHC